MFDVALILHSKGCVLFDNNLCWQLTTPQYFYGKCSNWLVLLL